jgi:Spy/CpxP family protein refolding chaperone
MQRRWHSWVFVLVLLAARWVFGQEQGPSPKQIPSPAQQSYGPHRSLEALGELRMLTQQLSLTSEQREKVRPIVTEEGEQLRLVRLDEHLTPDQKRQMSLEIRESFQPKIAAVLTSEQQQKFKKMQEAYQWKRPAGAKDSVTPPTPPK